MAGKKDKTRQMAKDYFVENFEATKKEIAELYGVTEKTVGDWSLKDDWETARLNFHSSPVRIKQLLQAELLNLAQGKPATLPADSISKLFSALDKVEKKVDATVVSRILKELDNFIAEANPKLAVECTHYHKQFLIHRINLET